MNIDRALGGKVFEVDIFQCREAALELSKFKPSIEITPWARENILSQFVFKVLFISICHQFNWDYLQDSLAKWLFPNAESHLREVEQIRSSKIEELLAAYNKPERIRAQERADLLRSTAKELSQLLESGVLKTFLKNPTLIGSGGFYEMMRKFTAFSSDPVEKKMRVLAHDLYREEIIKFSDPENLRPAVEYHIIRLYLRTGRVYPKNNVIRDVLVGPQSQPRTRLVYQLRLAVEEAMGFVSLYSKLDMATLNYVEWQIGRSRCVASLDSISGPTKCRSEYIETLPHDLQELLVKKCPFSDTCLSLNRSDYGWYHEPQFEKAIY